MTSDLDTRRRRAAYRAHHRGTKEMDWLVGRYADAHLDRFDVDELTRFERFLEIADPELQRWLMGAEPMGESEFAALVEDMRVFHGLEPRSSVR